MRLLGLIFVAMTMTGCAIVDDPAAVQERQAMFRPIDGAKSDHGVEHGVITAREIHQRSDIVVMPPSVQHVVWRRDGSNLLTVTTAAEEKPLVEETPTTKDEAQLRAVRTPKDNWPLLAEDMNFDQEIGRVDMCDRMQPCGPEDSCMDLEPCENPERYECFMTKPGEYCLEREE